MDMVPDGSVDAVVITLVLCSVKDIKKIVQQVLRVLVPVSAGPTDSGAGECW